MTNTFPQTTNAPGNQSVVTAASRLCECRRGIEAADQALGGAMLVDTVEVVGAEVGEGDGTLQHVEGGDRDLVRDGHGGLLRAHADPQPMELVTQVAAYCERNLVECFFLKIKHFRRIATRYEQTSRAFLSMLSIISAFIWTR